MNTNYTQECPLCGCENVEEVFNPFATSNIDDLYTCTHCTSDWMVRCGGADYEVLSDNTDGVPWETIAERCRYEN